MKSTSTDPRALRTRDMLRDALMTKVIEKPFRDLTIQDITEEAGVNRATFYLHYEDKYDLLEDCADKQFEEIREEIGEIVQLIPLSNPPQPFVEHNWRMTIVLQHIKKHSDFYRAILSKDGDPIFYNLFRENASIWIRSQLKDLMASQQKSVDDDLIEMLVRFQSAGNFDVLIWWLENDMPVPIDVMARRLAHITMPPLVQLIKGHMQDL